MSLQESEPATLLPASGIDRHPHVKVEGASSIQVFHSENDNASSWTATPGIALPSIGKRKERDEKEKDNVKNENDSDATISSNEDVPHTKRRRTGSNETEGLNEELQADTETGSVVTGEAITAVESGKERLENRQDGQGDAATSTDLLADGGPSVSAKKRRLSDDCEEDAIKPQLPAPTVDVHSGPSSETATTASSSPETQGSGTPPAKKARLGGHSDHNPITSDYAASDEQGTYNNCPPPSPAQRSSLLTLPLELLAEILVLTGSSQHVLATARTCKTLCTTLLSPDAQFIWREARKGHGCTFEYSFLVDNDSSTGQWNPGAATVQKVVVTLPDPPKRFLGEPAYAAFVFDGGKCEFCHNETSLSYASFALRARICKNPTCGNNVTSGRFRRVLPHERNSPAFQLVSMNEGPFLIGRSYIGSAMWPETSISYVRPEQVNAAATMVISDFRDQEKIDKTKKRNEEWMKFCVELHKWNNLRVKQLNRMKDINLSASKQIASSYGWEYDDLNNTIYGPYQLRKTKLIEKINEVDVRVMREEIESQLLALAERRQRRHAEISLMKNREDVETVYNRLRSTKTHPYLPSLPIFRKLPVVEMLQSAERPTTVVSVADTLQNDKVLKELLSSQLKKWVNKAKDDLGVVLGFPKNWKNASKNILHPVERVTGRFVCKKCGCVEPKYRMDGCFDFAGACSHECVVGNKEKGRLRTGKKAIWDAANFVKDDKAVNVLKASLAALGHAEDRQAGNYLLTVGLAVVCMSCEPSMVLDSRSLIGHSHRHDNMKVSFALEDIVSCCGGFPYRHGLVQKLLGQLSYSVAGKKEIDRKNYGCRHCLRQKQVAEAAAVAATSSSTSSQKSGDSVSNQAVESGAQNSTATALPAVRLRNANSELVELSAIIYQMHDLGVEGPLEKPPPLFNFNGMRSHLKDKHQIEEIRDEDIFCFRDLEITL